MCNLKSEHLKIIARGNEHGPILYKNWCDVISAIIFSINSLKCTVQIDTDANLCKSDAQDTIETW